MDVSHTAPEAFETLGLESMPDAVGKVLEAVAVPSQMQGTRKTRQ